MQRQGSGDRYQDRIYKRKHEKTKFTAMPGQISLVGYFGEACSGPGKLLLAAFSSESGLGDFGGC